MSKILKNCLMNTRKIEWRMIIYSIIFFKKQKQRKTGPLFSCDSFKILLMAYRHEIRARVISLLLLNEKEISHLFSLL